MSHTLKLANFTGSKADFSPGRGELANGLVFYADLWHPEQQGFCLSYDGNDYLTNATANFRSGDSLGTYECTLFRSASVANNQTLFASSDTGTDTSRLIGYVAVTTGFITISAVNAGGTVNTVRGSTNICDGKNHSIVITSNGTAWSIFLDGVEETLVVSSGANTGDWFADVTLRDNITIGAHTKTTTTNYAIAVMAQHRIYSRTMAAAEALLNTQRGWKASASDTTGLVFNLPCTEGTGNPVDTVIPATMTLTGATWIESLIDRSTNATPISAFGIPTWSNQGRTHNGSSHYSTTTANPSFANGVTALSWAKHTGIGAGNERYINKNDGTTTPFDLFMAGATSNIAMVIGAVTATTPNSSISQDIWYFAGGTYNLSAIQCYLNGVASGASAAQSGAPPTNSALITMGARSALATYFEGVMGEVWLYNRALSAAEINQIYQATRWRYGV